jgi:hypothetical protein
MGARIELIDRVDRGRVVGLDAVVTFALRDPAGPKHPPPGLTQQSRRNDNRAHDTE